MSEFLSLSVSALVCVCLLVSIHVSSEALPTSSLFAFLSLRKTRKEEGGWAGKSVCRLAE